MQPFRSVDHLYQAKKFIEPKDFREMHHTARLAVEKLKTQEAEVIKALQKVDQYKVYRYLGFNSLFQYALSLGLSENQSYNFITVARKSASCPELQRAIENKEITVSKAKTISSVIEEKNQMHWLDLARTLPKRELKREVAKVSPGTVKKESARYVTKHILELNIMVTEETFKLLERVKELMAQKTRVPVALNDALKFLAQNYVNKEDPVQKADRIINKKSGKEQLVPGRVVAKKNNEKAQPKVRSSGVRKHIPSIIKHQVYLRDRGECQYKDLNGRTCKQRQWIDLHHIKPKSQGGLDILENLMTVCRNHHLLIHGQKTYTKRIELQSMG